MMATWFILLCAIACTVTGAAHDEYGKHKQLDKGPVCKIGHVYEFDGRTIVKQLCHGDPAQCRSDFRAVPSHVSCHKGYAQVACKTPAGHCVLKQKSLHSESIHVVYKGSRFPACPHLHFRQQWQQRHVHCHQNQVVVSKCVPKGKLVCAVSRTYLDGRRTFEYISGGEHDACPAGYIEKQGRVKLRCRRHKSILKVCCVNDPLHAKPYLQ